jgi:hypothetical protein
MPHAGDAGYAQNAVWDWLNFAASSPQFGSMQWYQNNAGGADVLPAGIYNLGTLPTGLSAADFGNADGGAGNTIGSVFFIPTSGGEIDATVTIVPEPSALALCAAGLAVAAGIWRRRSGRSTR